MRFLAIENSFMLDRPITAPVGNGRNRFVTNGTGEWPMLQHDRGQSFQPRNAACWHAAGGLAKRLTDRNPMRVTAEAAVYSLPVPELVESRVEIEVDAHENA